MLVDSAILAVAEHLVAEFPAETERTVIGIVVECADEHPTRDLEFVERAARTRLRARRETPDDAGTASPDDVLDVSLEDTELLAEVALLTDVIIAAGQVDGPLKQDEIDRLLGLPP